MVIVLLLLFFFGVFLFFLISSIKSGRTTNCCGATICRDHYPLRFWIAIGNQVLAVLFFLGAAIFLVFHEQIFALLNKQVNWKPYVAPVFCAFFGLVYLVSLVLATITGEIRISSASGLCRMIRKGDEPIYFWLIVGFHIIIFLGLFALSIIFYLGAF